MGINGGGEQEAWKLPSLSPLTFTGARKEDDDKMVAWSVKSPGWRWPSDVALEDRWELGGDIGDNINSTWREQ